MQKLCKVKLLFFWGNSPFSVLNNAYMYSFLGYGKKRSMWGLHKRNNKNGLQLMNLPFAPSVSLET